MVWVATCSGLPGAQCVSANCTPNPAVYLNLYWLPRPEDRVPMVDRNISGSASWWAIVAAFAGIYVIWGTTYLAIALTIETIPPFVAGATRFLIAAALMYLWLRRRSARPLGNVNLIAAAWSGVLLSGIGNGFVIWAQQGTA